MFNTFSHLKGMELSHSPRNNLGKTGNINLYLEKINRRSPPEVLFGKGFLKICSKFKGEHSCRGAISITLQSIFNFRQSGRSVLH